MENILEFVNQLFQVHYSTTIKFSSVWFYWPVVTHSIVSVSYMLENMKATIIAKF